MYLCSFILPYATFLVKFWDFILYFLCCYVSEICNIIANRNNYSYSCKSIYTYRGVVNGQKRTNSKHQVLTEENPDEISARPEHSVKNIP
jgi:hypothetical protein